MNRCKFRRRSKGLQVGNYYPIILFKLGLQVIRPCSCHRICTTFCVINNFIAMKNIDLILSFTGMHTLWSSHKYDNFYNLHQQHKVFSRLSDWMWYLFYDIFQNSFFMENHLAEHVHIFWNYICIMEWTDSLQEALIENQDRVLYYMFLISFHCSTELLIFRHACQGTLFSLNYTMAI